MLSTIFQHSLTRHLRLLAIFPSTFGAFYLVYLLVLQPSGRQLGSEVFSVALLPISYCLAVFIAILVGIAIIADDRQAGSDQFLLRLPVSRRRLLTEKFAAGTLFLLGLSALIISYYLLLPDAESAWRGDGIQSFLSFPFSLMLSLSLAFVAAVAYSLFLRQPLVIFLAALCTVGMAWLLLQVLMTEVRMDWRGAGLSLTYLFLFFALPGILGRQQWQLSLPDSLLRPPSGRRPFSALLLKELAAEGFLQLLALLLLLAAMAFWFLLPEAAQLSRQELYEAQHNVPRYLLIGIAALLPITLGAHAYSANEGQGLACILYNHPASRQQLFLAKLLAAAPLLFCCWLSLLLVYDPAVPAFSLALFLFFLFVAALHTSLWLVSPMLNILLVTCAAILVYYLIGGWMTAREAPWYFRGFSPLNDPYLVGLIPLSGLLLGCSIASWRQACDRRYLAATAERKARLSGISWLLVILITLLVSALARRLFAL